MSAVHGAGEAIGFRVIEAVNGSLRGAVTGGVAAYRGIPYGATTAGRNRFLPPQPVDSWSGVRDALELGPHCPQVVAGHFQYPAWVDPSAEREDCLVLNVWAPDYAAPPSKLPVMVWLHGGAYAFGSAGEPGYDGANLALGGDVVVVGVNHRLSTLGYSYLGDTADERFADSGNAGHLDILAALRWVQENIAAFGGDPGNVTIFGQSGGGGKVATLMAMDGAKGLFHKAIVMSGATPRLISLDDAVEVSARLYRALGIRHGDVETLQAVPAQTLARFIDVLKEQDAQQSKDGTGDHDGLIHRLKYYGPMLDGRTFAEQPWVNGAPEISRNIPMLIGTTLHETVGLFGAFPGELDRQSGDDRDFARQVIHGVMISRVLPEELVPLIARYREAVPTLSPTELLVRISTDISFWRNAILLSSAKADQDGASVFAYECAWTTPCFGSSWALHGVELPFVFNRPEYGTAWDGADSDELRAAADPEGRRFEVGAQMLSAWTRFARTGDPSTDALAWPAYDTTTRPTMVFAASTSLVEDLRSELRPHVTALTQL